MAFPLAVWRAQVADQQANATQRQAEAAQEQAAAAQRQAETAQGDLRNKRYQESAAMLGSDVLAVRLAGIYALQRLAEEHPEQYHIEIMKLLCAFVRHPAEDEVLYPMSDPSFGARADVQAAVEAISACHERESRLEEEAGYRLDLRGAALAEADLRDANLIGAKLNEVNLIKANLIKAKLIEANLSGATLVGATGLTQEQLDHAIADPNSPPLLVGVRDAKTGKQLVWRGRTVEGEPHPNPPEIPDD